jgi:hypothetical protein
MDTLNVFSPTFGNRPKRIVGRDKEIGDFIVGIEGRPGHKNRATFLIGQRGMGKTALLLELAEQSKRRGYIPVRVTAGEKMLDEIIEGIQINGAPFVEKKDKPVKSLSAGAFGFSFGLTFSDELQRNFGFRTKLTLLCEELAKADRRILILVDEVASSTPQMRELATTYQHLVGDETDIAFAMAGLPSAISEVLNDTILTFLNRAHQVYLGALRLDAVSAYYLEVFTALGLGITPEVLDLAVTATKGYPFLLQLIGYYILDAVNASGESGITRALVEVAIMNSRRALEASIFKPSLRPLSDGDRRFIDAMAHDTGSSRISDLRVRLNVGSAHVQKYKERLVEAGIVTSERRGELSFTLPYMNEYLRGEL